MKKVLVIGGNGQLGQCLRVVMEDHSGVEAVFMSSSEANILQGETLMEAVSMHQPQLVINCAAYTAVDLAEDEPEKAYSLNAEGVLNLATVCQKQGLFLIHISTDFVFPGDIPLPLDETAVTNPLSVYGKSKLKGENILEAMLPDQSLIIRTSWLYSEFGNNFLKTMLRLAREHDSLGVVCDQVGTPTYARDLANFIWTCVEQDQCPSGILHFSNEGLASWYDFAAAIFDFSGLSVEMRPLRTEAYPTKATRPKFSVLDKTKAKEVVPVKIEHWVQALKRCLTHLEVSK